MTPKEAYDHTTKRARRLLLLHDGLINTGQRRIRNDWKESFCRFMRWPVGSTIERVHSRDALVVLRPDVALGPDDFSSDALDDLLRSSLTFGVSGLDRYVHERIVKGIISALKKSSLNSKQEKFSIPAVMALRATDAIRKAGGIRKRYAQRTLFESTSKSRFTKHHTRIGGRSKTPLS